jgi:ankyrin repeat protein
MYLFIFFKKKPIQMGSGLCCHSCCKRNDGYTGYVGYQWSRLRELILSFQKDLSAIQNEIDQILCRRFHEDDLTFIWCNALKTAIKCNHLEIVQLIVPRFITIDDSFDTTISLAILMDHTCIINYLLKNGELSNQAENTAMCTAIKYNNMRILRMLVEEKHAKLFYDDYEVMRVASGYGNIVCLDYLVQYLMRNTTVLFRRRAKWMNALDNCLKAASEIGSLECVTYLVTTCRAIVTPKCDAIEFAFIHGHLNIVKYLEEKGAYLSIRKSSHLVNYLVRGARVFQNQPYGNNRHGEVVVYMIRKQNIFSSVLKTLLEEFPEFRLFLLQYEHACVQRVCNVLLDANPILNRMDASLGEDRQQSIQTLNQTMEIDKKHTLLTAEPSRRCLTDIDSQSEILDLDNAFVHQTLACIVARSCELLCISVISEIPATSTSSSLLWTL